MRMPRPADDPIADTADHRLGRAWDSFDVYLFDIDGTLLTCTDATHYFAFCHALKMLSGQELTLDGVTTHGNVDAGILRDALKLADVPEQAWQPQLSKALEAMCDHVELRQTEVHTCILPRVREMLEHLRARGALLGVATGNLGRIGRLKLERAGLWSYFDFAGWSDGYQHRQDVFRAALEEARRRRGAGAAICVVGDTPHDIHAAHANQQPAIAVATGIYSCEQLSEAQPERVLHSFADLFPLRERDD